MVSFLFTLSVILAVFHLVCSFTSLALASKNIVLAGKLNAAGLGFLLGAVLTIIPALLLY